jgi:hypothetical protein
MIKDIKERVKRVTREWKVEKRQIYERIKQRNKGTLQHLCYIEVMRNTRHKHGEGRTVVAIYSIDCRICRGSRVSRHPASAWCYEIYMTCNTYFWHVATDGPICRDEFLFCVLPDRARVLVVTVGPSITRTYPVSRPEPRQCRSSSFCGCSNDVSPTISVVLFFLQTGSHPRHQENRYATQSITCYNQVSVGRRDQSRWQRDILYPQELVLASPTSGGRSVDIVSSRTTATELS